MPEITGDTENGRSIRVVKDALPLNSNLATAQAAATPKTRLSGTAMAATSSVSLIAATPSRSLSALRNTAGPLANACVNTATSGSSRITARNSTAMPISVHLTAGLSLVGTERPAAGLRRGAAASALPAEGSTAIAKPPPAPRLHQIDNQQHDERDHQHDRPYRGRRRLVELLQPDDDEERGNLRFIVVFCCDGDHR